MNVCVTMSALQQTTMTALNPMCYHVSLTINSHDCIEPECHHVSPAINNHDCITLCATILGLK